MNNGFTIPIKQNVSHSLIETTSVVILFVFWFIVFNSISYLINDSLPAYQKTDTITNVWFWLIVELITTLVCFHLAVKLLNNVCKSTFQYYQQINILVEMHSATLACFSLICFQDSFRERTKRAWTSFFGQTRKAKV